MKMLINCWLGNEDIQQVDCVWQLSENARRAWNCMVYFQRRIKDERWLLDTFHKIELIDSGKGADPKSPVGTAFSFSRPKRQATAIANISRVLQFASKRFVNSFLNL